MADESDIADDPHPRSDAFFAALGVPPWFYASSMQRAIQRAINDPADATPSPWAAMGARNIGGRIRALVQDPRNPEVLFAGTGYGGVFVSRDDGDTWAPLGAAQDSFPVGALALDAKVPGLLYVGSGEPLIFHSITGGVVAGSTWDAAGVGFYRADTTATPVVMVQEVGAYSQVGPVAGAADRYARIVCDPGSARRCWIASDTGLWRRDQANAAAPVLFVREPVPLPLPVTPALPVAPPPPLLPPVPSVARPFGAGCSDVVLLPHPDPARKGVHRLYVAVCGQGIYRGVFDANVGAPATVWEAVPLAGGLPAPGSAAGLTHDRIRIAACQSQPQHLYAIFETGSNSPNARQVLDVFYSADGGDHWQPSGPRPPAAPVVPPVLRAQLGGQPWGHLIIAVHPDNPAIVLAGATNLSRSTDFGVNWSLVMDWQNWSRGDRAQHGDMHALVFDAQDPRRLWVANDSGLSVTPDIVLGNPRTSQGWRKRSHGITAAQFNDVAVHPVYPYMIGGGLQDNGGYVSFGGESWFPIGDADGGQIAFEQRDPRTFIAPNQARVIRSVVVAPTTVEPNPGFYPLVQRRLVNGDQNPPNDTFACQLSSREVLPLRSTAALFVPVVEHHPGLGLHLLVGRGFTAAVVAPPTPAVPADVFVSIDGGTSFAATGVPAAIIGIDSVNALAYGNGVNAQSDWWVGTTGGGVGVATNTGVTVWTNRPLPASAAGQIVTRIAVHPRSSNLVAVATGGNSGVTEQGRVFVSHDRGLNWRDITGVAQALPSCPVLALAWDPQPLPAQNQTLFAGTLAGVYVVRNLPRIGAAAAVIAALNPLWASFNARGGPGPLPLTLVNDLRIVSLAARTGPDLVALSPESVPRFRLIAALYGRGMYACDITRAPAAGAAVGGPAQRVYLRQTVIEDGLSYPRPTPTELNSAPNGTAPFRLGGDPRFPINTLRFTDHDAFDIRIDNSPFQFFEDVLDGVEFDEDLHTKAVLAGARNVVYVQVHSCGWSSVVSATVHLYFAASPAPAADPNAAPVPDLHADFWAHWLDATLPAPALAPVGNAAAWQRAGVPVHLNAVGPNQPEVARIEWLAPATLPAFVALLALVTTPNGVDPLVPAGQPTVMATLLRRERRAAFRVAPVTPFVPDLFIRDGLDDTGRLGGVAFGGRSPDIIVVPAALADVPGATADLANPRSADRVLPGPADNFVYVRVQNRTAVATPVDVALFWAKSNPATSAAVDPAGPVTDNTKWQAAVGLGPVANVAVPAGGAVLVGFKISNLPAAEAGLANSLALIALINASNPGDAQPLRTRVRDAASFSRFFLQLADSNNAALRTVRYA